MRLGDTVHRPVWLWRLNTTEGSGFFMVLLPRACKNHRPRSQQGSQAGRSPLYSAPGQVLSQVLSHDAYRSTTSAPNQVGTHLTEEVWGEEKTGRGPRGSPQARQGIGWQGKSLLELPEERATQMKPKDDKLKRNPSSREV